MISEYLPVLAIAIGLLAVPSSFAAIQAAPATAHKPLPFVSPIFDDNMVLQRGKRNTIWGWSEPGDTVQVRIGDDIGSGIAGADGRWHVKFQPPAPGGPYTVRITGHQTVELHNILVGDVWLCGGQSNMGLPLRFTRNGPEEVKTANYPEIRFFTVADHPAYRRTDIAEGSWKVVSPENADWISAVRYYFARRIQRDIHIPIGLVVDAVGGSPAEAWTSAAALRPLKDFDIPLAEVERWTAAGAPEYGNYVMHWYDQFDVGLKENWSAPDLDDSSWKQVAMHP